MTLVSTSFINGGDIPRYHTCDGANASPPLSWADTPPETRSFATIMDDPDAPDGLFIHWVLFDIPASRADLPPQFRAGLLGVSGRNSRSELGYFGPCPPSGVHRYYFRLTALDVATLGLK